MLLKLFNWEQGCSIPGHQQDQQLGSQSPQRFSIYQLNLLARFCVNHLENFIGKEVRDTEETEFKRCLSGVYLSIAVSDIPLAKTTQNQAPYYMEIFTLNIQNLYSCAAVSFHW